MFKRAKFGIICVIFFIICVISGYAQEEITITTYYPSPYGSYNDLYVANRLGIGTTGPTEKLDVRNGAIRVGYDTDTFDQLIEFWRNGIKIGAIDNSASDVRIKALNNNGVFIIDDSNNGLVVKDGGNVGIGTTDPIFKVDINAGTSESGLRLLGSNSLRTYLSIRHTNRTAGNYGTLNFNFDSGASVSTASVRGIDVAGDTDFETDLQFTVMNTAGSEVQAVRIDGNTGNVGIGTTSPAAKLSIEENRDYWTASIRNTAITSDAHGLAVTLPNTSSVSNYVFQASGGGGGIMVKANGSIYQTRDGSLLHADYVFEPDYKLESIEEHSEYMWKHKHLKAVPKAETNESGQGVVEIGAQSKGILEELEKTHIYIEQLNERIKVLEMKLSKLER